jgi:Flp pilus assembly protein CpaB
MHRGRSRTPRWRRRQRVRRAAVTGLVVLACLAAASEFAVRETGTVVVLAASDLPAGTLLGPDHLTTVPVPVASPLDRVGLPTNDVVGRTLAASVAAGEMITASRLFGTDGAVASPGTTTMPVVFAEPAIAGFLQPGMVVDLLWTPGTLDPGGARVVASGARVLSTPQEPSGGGMFSTGDRAAPVLLEVRTADAPTTAAALGTGALTVALHRGPGSGLPVAPPGTGSDGSGAGPPDPGRVDTDPPPPAPGTSGMDDRDLPDGSQPLDRGPAASAQLP